MNYDSDYEIQDDTPGTRVDIDPYAGLSTRHFRALVVELMCIRTRHLLFQGQT